MRWAAPAALAAAALLAVTGCNTVVTGRGLQAGVPTGGPPAMTPSTSPPPPPTTSGVPEPAVFVLGQTGTVTDADGAPLADVTVESAVLSPDPPDEFSDPPDNGAFLAATVSVRNLSDEPFAVAPLDFEVRYPDGTRVTYGSGSAGAFGYDDPLGTADLAAGESVTGVVAFDVAADLTGIRIDYVDLTGRVLGSWLVPADG